MTESTRALVNCTCMVGGLLATCGERFVTIPVYADLETRQAFVEIEEVEQAVLSNHWDCWADRVEAEMRGER